MPPRAHQHAGFVFSGMHQVGPQRLDIDVHAGSAALYLEPRLNRNVNKIILRLAKGAPYLLGHANHKIRFAVDVNGPAQRVHAAEKSLGNVAADHGYIGPVLVIWFGYVPADGRLFGVNSSHVGGDAAHVDVLDRLRLVLYFSIAPYFQTHSLGQPHVVTDILVVFPSNVLVGARQLDELLLAGDERKTHYQKDIGTEIGHFFRHIPVGRLDHGNHYDQR